jgi:CrcB protein
MSGVGGEGMIWLAVAIGGAMGSVARHGVNIALARTTGQAMPYATAVVNIAGSGIIGILAGLIASGRWNPENTVRAFVFVGLLGGFTTFSSLALDTLTLSRESRPGMAAVNIGLQIGFGLLAVFIGYRLGLGKVFAKP